MTTANTTSDWRRILTQHLRQQGGPGEGDHYPWKIYVDQFTGEQITPESAR
jgi:phytanoyl-CoA hydroxylase